MDARIAAWAEAPRSRLAPARWQSWPAIGAMGLCLALHLVFFFWLYQHQPRVSAIERAAARPLSVHWIETRDLRASPPMPRKSRPVRRAAPTPLPPRLSPTAPAPAASAQAAPPPGRRLVDQLDDPSLLPGGDTLFQRPDPLRRILPRLPGSDERIIGSFTLRRELSPKDVVAVVGSWFGAYDSCRDVSGLIQDATLQRPDRYDDAQRRDLFERERRCGRR